MSFSKEKAEAAANEAIARGQINKAIQQFERIAETDPSDSRARMKLGELYLKVNRVEDAIRVQRETARLLADQGFTLKAVAVYKQILVLNPNLAEDSMALASLYHQQGLLSEAVRQYKEAAKLYASQGNTVERLHVIRRIVDLDQSNVADRVRLAEAYSASGNYDDAVSVFRDACRALERRKRPQSYCKVAERLLHHKPDDLATNRKVAEHYLKDRDPQRALPKLRICYRQHPHDTEVLEMLHETFVLLGQEHKAVTVLRELARIYDANGLPNERTKAFQRILALVPSDPQARQVLDVQTAVGQHDMVFELDASGKSEIKATGATRDSVPSDEETFEEIDIDDADLIEEDGSGEKPTSGVREELDTIRDVGPAGALRFDKLGAAAALEALRSGADTERLDALFDELDQELDIDIQEEGEDTVVVTDRPGGGFEELDFDDPLADSAPKSTRVTGLRAASRPAHGTAPRRGSPVGGLEEVDFDSLLAEADQAVGGGPAMRPSHAMDPQLAAALAEVDFYLEQGLRDDALSLLGSLQKSHPAHIEVQRRTKKARAL